MSFNADSAGNALQTEQKRVLEGPARLSVFEVQSEPDTWSGAVEEPVAPSNGAPSNAQHHPLRG